MWHLKPLQKILHKDLDSLKFNEFIFRHVIVHILKTENIIPFILATCIIFFSLLIFEAQFIFIPQSSLTSFASFLIFVSASCLIVIMIYPLLVITVINLIFSFININSSLKAIIKIFTLFISFAMGVIIFSGPHATTAIKIQTLIIWIGFYFIMIEMYLAKVQHNSVFKLRKTKYFMILIISTLTAQPLVSIFMHAVEVMNFTNVNPQIYLSQANCNLLKNLDEQYQLPDNNSIFNDKHYYKDIANDQGCEIYNNVIRFSFASDYALMIKKNIRPIITDSGGRYNEYVRLNCYSGYCYTENYIFLSADNDINDELIKKEAHKRLPN